MDFTAVTDLFNTYMKAEFIILLPVLYVINKLISNTKWKKHGPVLISCISILLCAVYLASNCPTARFYEIMLIAFTSITQGVLYAGICLYGKKLLPSSKCDCEKKERTHEK